MRNYGDPCDGVRKIREAVETTFGNAFLPDAERSETPVHECEVIAGAIYTAGQLPSKPRGSQKLAVFMRHRDVDYIVEEIEPGRWCWKFSLPDRIAAYWLAKPRFARARQRLKLVTGRSTTL
jgi:hypothetical protein